MSSIQELKNRRKNIEERQKKYESVTGNKKFEKDTRYWTPTQDEHGNGSAKIRFLDAPPGEDFPFVKMLTYSFKGDNGKWYIENSPRSISEDYKDPVYEYNGKIRGDKSKAHLYKKMTTKYHSNILVIEDTGNPENNGKVFLFAYGKKILDKITALLNPEFKDEKSVDAFDFWDGATFRLKVKKIKGEDGKPTNNYDTSSFDEPSELFGGDEEKIDAVWRKCYSLKELHNPKNFKTYEQLKQRFDSVMGDNDEPTRSPKPAEDPMDEELDDKDLGMPTESVKNFDLDDEDDDLSRFNDV
jgi:hypothetical protein